MVGILSLFISFLFLQPPKICSFQKASHMLTFTDGNKTWSTNVKQIIDSSKQVYKEMENEFQEDKEYLVTAIVITDYGNFSSNSTFCELLAYQLGIFRGKIIISNSWDNYL